MLTLFMVIACFVVGALVISAIAGLLAIAPVILAVCALVLIDVFVIKLLFRRKKKKKD